MSVAVAERTISQQIAAELDIRVRRYRDAWTGGEVTVTDIFCGGGGSSTGMIQIPGVRVTMAANHWDLAVKNHSANHPGADHAAVDLHEEDPRYFPTTDILWASPECTKWSQASGGKYISVSTELDLLDLLNPDLVEEDPETAIVQRSRLLMFDVLRFVEHHRYKAVIVENVVDVARNPKFADAWALWQKGLRNLGYKYRVVSLNSMHAQAHGAPAPQSRDRLYVVAVREDIPFPDIDKVLRPMAWCPTCEAAVESQQAWKNGRTVGKYRSQYVYVHGACGTTVEPAFLPAAAAIDWGIVGKRIGDRPKPLADKTRRRIAAGIARYWSPFHMESGGNQYDAADPKHKSFGDPNAYYRAWPVEEPLRTLHTQETKALVVPLEGRAGDRVKSVGDPLRTQTSRHLDAFVTDAQFGGRDWSVADVAPTQTTYDTAAVIESPFIAELRGGGSDARSVESPLSTVTASGNHHGLVTPYYGASESAKPVDQPIGTLTTVDRYALITRHFGSPVGGEASMTTPISEALRTLTTTAQQSVLTPGDIDAAAATVDDCLFRMLEPHEVAAGMAFPSDYIWHGTRRERVKLAGNAVTPPAARDLISAVVEVLGGLDIAA
ncbi:DNA cytosine methyltransferase [Nocardioides jejuensis]|uniref:DNA (cytosine-5-)-methyltransferase n=1 Tax=Nocardioides jejuensis TaxID=2502782 RepID=A0A4R1BZ56_9ACTN|nr:DNA cytosine methyltransferase [Nocardioides jejuensis]TCJ23038.1 DNA cytosine methyltransferase [Nocardioides jejuensis]